METIIWIFHNVMPWIGAYFVIMTIAFFVLLSIKLLKYKGTKNIYTNYDITELTELAIEASVVVNIIPMIFIKLISWSVEKIIKKSKADRGKA